MTVCKTYLNPAPILLQIMFQIIAKIVHTSGSLNPQGCREAVTSDVITVARTPSFSFRFQLQHSFLSFGLEPFTPKDALKRYHLICSSISISFPHFRRTDTFSPLLPLRGLQIRCSTPPPGHLPVLRRHRLGTRAQSASQLRNYSRILLNPTCSHLRQRSRLRVLDRTIPHKIKYHC
jgi:hypothetical protein